MPISPLPWKVVDDRTVGWCAQRIVDANGQPVAMVWSSTNITAIVNAMNALGPLVEAATAALTAGAEMTPEYCARLEAALLPFEHLVPPERRFLLGTQPVAPAYAVLTPEVLQDAYDVTVRASEERLRALSPPVAPARLVEAEADRCTACDGYGRTYIDGGPVVDICDLCDGTGGNPRSRLPDHLK